MDCDWFHFSAHVSNLKNHVDISDQSKPGILLILKVHSVYYFIVPIASSFENVYIVSLARILIQNIIIQYLQPVFFLLILTQLSYYST